MRGRESVRNKERESERERECVCERERRGAEIYIEIDEAGLEELRRAPTCFPMMSAISSAYSTDRFTAQRRKPE